jgi:hypothetical protein
VVKALIVIDISYVFWSWMGVYQYDETGVSADFFTSAFRASIRKFTYS